MKQVEKLPKTLEKMRNRVDVAFLKRLKVKNRITELLSQDQVKAYHIRIQNPKAIMPVILSL